jgi:A/G-specific adenine glycosylase
MKRITDQQIPELYARLISHYIDQKRTMPWREPRADGTFDPYAIMVSELMLQQTQVSRVIPKFVAFISRFPNIQSLAHARLADVLQLWSGLGYNRRAKYLWETARMIERDFGGNLPGSIDELKKLPGVGINTAGAILAYAFNQPVGFIETNIRTVFIHHFFADSDKVADTELLPLVNALLQLWLSQSGHGSREYYWALMDYGTHLKTTAGNSARRSKAYAKQSRFQGSKRQVRGAVLRALAAGPLPRTELERQINDSRFAAVCEELLIEGLINQQGPKLYLGT